MWEMEGVRRARRRYEEATAAADPSTLPAGQWLLRQVVPPLIARITALQGEASSIVGCRGEQAKWAWPILLLEASALAVITVTVALNSVRRRVPATSVMNTVSSTVRTEVEYRRWVTAQAASNKAAKAAQDWEHRDLLAEMRRLYPAMNRKTWARWRRRVEDLEREEWDNATEVQLGATLLSALVDAAPNHFKWDVETSEGRTTRYLTLTGEAADVMRDIQEGASVSRPQLMPMIVPPVPWQYANPGVGHSTQPHDRNRAPRIDRHPEDT